MYKIELLETDRLIDIEKNTMIKAEAISFDPLYITVYKKNNQSKKYPLGSLEMYNIDEENSNRILNCENDVFK